LLPIGDEAELKKKVPTPGGLTGVGHNLRDQGAFGGKNGKNIAQSAAKSERILLEDTTALGPDEFAYRELLGEIWFAKIWRHGGLRALTLLLLPDRKLYLLRHDRVVAWRTRNRNRDVWIVNGNAEPHLRV
jgi:hypothetical protein